MQQPTPPRVGLVLVAAGSGSRLGAGVPKAFVELAGMSLLAHSLERLGPHVAQIVVVAPSTHMAMAREIASATGHRVDVVPGGDTRAASVASGLAVLSQIDVVAVHDAARPLVDGQALRACVQAVTDGASAAAPAVPVTDTLKKVDGDGMTVLGTVDRSPLRGVQTPQVFPLQLLLDAHAQNIDPSVTDDLALVEANGGRVVLTRGDQRFMKITHADDLIIAEALIQATTARPIIDGHGAAPGTVSA